MDKNLYIKRLSKQEVQEILVKYGVQKDYQFSEEYLLNIYRENEKILIVTDSGNGAEFPDEERFVLYYKPFVEELKALQKRNLREEGKTFLLPRQAQEFLKQYGWVEVEKMTIHEKSEQIFRNLDGRFIVLHDNKYATFFVSDIAFFETIPLPEETSQNNYGNNIINVFDLNEDQDFNNLSIFNTNQYDLTPDLLPVEIVKNLDEWVLNKIKYYKSFDFFETLLIEVNTDEFISRIRNEFIEYLDKLSNFSVIEFCSCFYRYDDRGNIIPNTPDERIELDLLRWDKNRVWHTDEYFDCLYLNLKYTTCIQRLSEISRGVFLPKSILETRKDDLIELQIFLEDNRKYLIYANKELIRFDDELIGQINYIIEDTNYFFEVEGLSSSHNPYEKMLVVMLNKEEQKRLSIEKGFFSAWQH